MAKTIWYPGCGAEFDAAAIPPGGEFACGVCGKRIEVDGPTPTAPRSGGRRRRSRRVSSRDLDPAAHQRAKARIRAVKICSTSFWCSIFAAIFLFVNVIACLAATISAMVAAIWGLVWLKALGTERRLDEELAPIERVAKKMTPRGIREGWSGLGIALAVSALFACIALGVV